MKIIVSLLLFMGLLLGAEVGTIYKIEGKVKILKANEIKSKKVTLNEKIFKGDVLITYSNAMATIKVADGSFITLGEKAKLRVSDLNNFKQEGGKIFYNIKTKTSNELKVGTNFATIGVKGTKFIITDMSNIKNVSLKKGLVGVASLKGEFEIHTTAESKLSEFEKYKLAHKYAFQEYEKKMNEEFIEFKKEFDLVPNKTVTFNKNVVKEENMNQNNIVEFDKFEKFQK